MTIDERMRKCQTSLTRSMERLDRAFGQIDAAYREFADESRRYADQTAVLAGTIDRLHTNLRRYDGELKSVGGEVRVLGGNSRRLTAIMDGYLTGKTPSRSSSQSGVCMPCWSKDGGWSVESGPAQPFMGRQSNELR